MVSQCGTVLHWLESCMTNPYDWPRMQVSRLPPSIRIKHRPHSPLNQPGRKVGTGAASTLMSVDAESVAGGLETIYEFGAAIVSDPHKLCSMYGQCLLCVSCLSSLASRSYTSWPAGRHLLRSSLLLLFFLSLRHSANLSECVKQHG